MTTVKIKMTDGTIHNIQGEVEQITVKELDADQVWTLKAKNTNEDVEVYEFIGERTSREER
jgi:hypothetical protein